MKINKLKTVQRVKIFLGILLSFIVVVNITPRVFVAGSPQIKGSFVVWLKLTPQRIYAYVKYPFNTEARDESIINASLDTREDKQNLDYQPVSKGVYAAEDPTTKEKYVKIEKGTNIDVYYVTLSDGREIKVYVPVN